MLRAGGMAQRTGMLVLAPRAGWHLGTGHTCLRGHLSLLLFPPSFHLLGSETLQKHQSRQATKHYSPRGEQKINH